MKNFTKYLLVATLFYTGLQADERKSITLGTENWAPFSYKDKVTKKVSGLSTEIIDAVFKQMDIKITSTRVMPWARTQELGYEGKFDAVYTASINNERKQYMYFPKEPIIKSKWVLFAKKSDKDKLKFDNLKSLKGKKFCFISEYNYPKVFKEYIYKNAKVTTVSEEVLNIAKLLHGRCDYMPAVLETTIDLTKTNTMLKENNAYKNIFYFKKPLSISSFYLMFSKKRVLKEFVDKFSDTLVKFKKTKKYKEIVEKYL